MVFLILFSIGFAFLAIKGALGPKIEGSRFDAYFFIMLGLSLLCAVFPIRQELFESKMAHATEQLLEMDDVEVYCQSFFDTFYNRIGVAGFVYRGGKKIFLEPRTCDNMKAFLGDPENANIRQAYALKTLTHEAMHIGGEYNEIKTDCMAFQRNHRMAELLGVPTWLAEKTARNLHRQRSPRHPYYSEECEPGRALDENLPDAIWIGPVQ